MNSSQPSTSSLNGIQAALRERWQALGGQERRALLLAAAVAGLFLFWILALQPAWRTINKAPDTLNRLDTQLQDMRGLAQESQELRGVSPVSTTQAIASLQSATDRLGNQGRISIQADRATLTLSNVSPEALKDWLSEARSAARARPMEAQLNRSNAGYSGTILLVFGGAP
jgi:general secretion pathway protein M